MEYKNDRDAYDIVSKLYKYSTCKYHFVAVIFTCKNANSSSPNFMTIQ